MLQVLPMLASISTEAMVSQSDFAPIVAQLVANAKVIVPAGLGIMAVMVGIGFIPRILYKFL